MPSLIRLFCLGALALTTGLLASAQARAATLDRVAAIVNGKMITQFEVDERAKEFVEQVMGRKLDPKDPQYPEITKQVLNSMIDDILITQEAERFKISITDAEAESQIRQIKEQARMTEAQFVAQLKKEGMTRKSYVEQLKKDLLKRRVLSFMVQRKVLVTDDEMKAYLKDGGAAEASVGALSTTGPAQAQAPAPVAAGQVRLALIMVAKPDQAKLIKTEIDAGKISFADAARRHSIGPAKDTGGDLGVLSVRDLTPAVAKAVASLAPGKVSEPLPMDGKTVLVTLLDAAAPGAAPPREEAPVAGPGGNIQDREKRAAFEQLYRPKAEKLYREYLDKLRAKSVVEIKM